MATETNRINLYKLRSAASFTGIDPTDEGYRLEYSDEQTKLFVHPGRETSPQWIDYLSPLITNPVADVTNRSCAFLLLRLQGASCYAISGGGGYMELRDEVEDDFGLKLALRMIEEPATINQRSMKGTTRQIMRAVAGYDPLFDRENYNRILNALEGKAEFEGRRFRVKGKTSIVLRTVRSVEDLAEVITEVEAILATAEKIHFPRSYEDVSDEETIAALEAQLAEEFLSFWRGEGTREKLYVEFHDPLSQVRCERFIVKYGRKRIELEEFDLTLVRDALVGAGAASPTTRKDIDRLKVIGIDEAGNHEVTEESFSSLLVFEASIGNSNYIKFGKKWFKILDEIQSFLNEELANLTAYRDLLPQWNLSTHPTELSYNGFAATELAAHCLDQQLIQLDARSKIELCDIYEPITPRFFHVKRTWGFKAAYLFSQGVTSAEFYRNSDLFRAKCQEKWPELFGARINPEILFCIADERSQNESFPRNLSYFAKLSLHNAASSLRSQGYEVGIVAIDLIVQAGNE